MSAACGSGIRILRPRSGTVLVACTRGAHAGRHSHGVVSWANGPSRNAGALCGTYTEEQT